MGQNLNNSGAVNINTFTSSIAYVQGGFIDSIGNDFMWVQTKV